MAKKIDYFRAVVKGGDMIHFDPDLLKRYLKTFKDGTKLKVIIKKYIPARTISDPLRKYYFGHLMEEMSEETTHPVEVLHENMKERYASYYDQYGIRLTRSVWSNKSEMTIDEKWAFILKVRAFASDFLNLILNDPDPEWKKYQK